MKLKYSKFSCELTNYWNDKEMLFYEVLRGPEDIIILKAMINNRSLTHWENGAFWMMFYLLDHVMEDVIMIGSLSISSQSVFKQFTDYLKIFMLMYTLSTARQSGRNSETSQN